MRHRRGYTSTATKSPLRQDMSRPYNGSLFRTLLWTCGTIGMNTLIVNVSHVIAQIERPQTACIYSLLTEKISRTTSYSASLSFHSQASHHPINMALSAEERMNLATLQQTDPYISTIKANAKHVTLYTFKATTNEWVRQCLLVTTICWDTPLDVHSLIRHAALLIPM